MIISDETYERTRAAVDDIKCCCEIEDDYMEWEDIVAFSVMAFPEPLDEDQFKMTVAAFKEYAPDIGDNDPNFASGFLTMLDRCLRIGKLISRFNSNYWPSLLFLLAYVYVYSVGVKSGTVLSEMKIFIVEMN